MRRRAPPLRRRLSPGSAEANRVDLATPRARIPHQCHPSFFGGAIYLSQSLRFLRPVGLGDVITASVTSLRSARSITFYGSERVVEHYNLMGPVKAALESATRYLAAELGPGQIRVHAISPGPISTRAASGIDRFDELLERAAGSAPERTLVDISDVGAPAAFLVSEAARRITGTIIPVDGGQHLLA
jgi:NAD(P)-dependent dehydrogenase (short-subunit alcohol dehydrogenase family)